MKLTPGQAKNWVVREKEAYAIVSALKKWASWIGLQPVLILSDHKSLEEWAAETLGKPTGLSGRQARWHLLLSRFNVRVGYMPGRDNEIADIMSRWAYPACEDVEDVSMHGNAEDGQKVHDIIALEKARERSCCVFSLEWPDGLLKKLKNTTVEVDVITIFGKPRIVDLFSGTGS